MPRERHNASLLIDRNLEAGRAEKVAMLTAGEALTYGDVARRAAQWGNFLRAAGIRREDRVLMILDDTAAFPAVFLGTMRIGAVPIPVNPMDRADNYAYYLEDSDAKALVVDAALLPAISASPDLLVVVANGPA